MVAIIDLNVTGDNMRDDSFTVMQGFLSKYPKIDAVWASNDDMAIGVLGTIEAAGRNDIQFVWAVPA
ncbi:substrate-binding domain-containing protein [Octadecabacter antarcticus]|uniref:substrate-binding domain-containing protein n=1 Tax=Octadecabacter antarcticus TaxID=1217908 RepID=UPI00018066C2|nr:substrate-binding domain-containing protein [Octadecabacter antarcticus]